MNTPNSHLRRSLAALFSITVLLGGLAACSSDDPSASNTTPVSVTPTPSKTLTAEEAAYAAAEDSYREYVKFEDTMMQNGGKYNDDDLWKYVSGEMRPAFIKAANSYLEDDLIPKGSTDIRWIDDESIDKKTGNVEEVKLLVCLSKEKIVFYNRDGTQAGTYDDKFWVREITLQRVESNLPWKVTFSKKVKTDKACS